MRNETEENVGMSVVELALREKELEKEIQQAEWEASRLEDAGQIEDARCAIDALEEELEDVKLTSHFLSGFYVVELICPAGHTEMAPGLGANTKDPGIAAEMNYNADMAYEYAGGCPVCGQKQKFNRVVIHTGEGTTADMIEDDWEDECEGEQRAIAEQEAGIRECELDYEEDSDFRLNHGN